VVQKGGRDIIANDRNGKVQSKLSVANGSIDMFGTVFISDSDGGLKRMGGQGDILSGTIATFLAWGKAYQDGVWK
jgi:ATP-dependent NAD(P)H-hydrate dehydratase